MSELDGQLRAQGGACEHLAKLFAHKRGMTEGGFPCPPLSTTPWADALKQLLARIAEMEAENERLRKGLRLIIERPPGQAHRIAIQMLEADREGK